MADGAHRERRASFVEAALATIPIEDYDLDVTRAHADLLAHTHRMGGLAAPTTYSWPPPPLRLGGRSCQRLPPKLRQYQRRGRWRPWCGTTPSGRISMGQPGATGS